ncbi:MAG: di-trans,poly-cis-decaprenylcistransferase [Clostridiales bacterium]|jgi:undecaprenyl diphosphate synthase|nr:di-trans,poly-cis-decaprenylcistransferase [Clostridiales bacterium]
MKTADPARLPRHVAIIMDGNGRWAKKRFSPRKAGHAAGAQALRRLVERMDKLGFERLTVFAFSTENWKRSDEEVYDIMNLLRDYIRQYAEDADGSAVSIGFIGDLSRLDEDLRSKIHELRLMTKNHPGMKLTIAVNYGGRDDIVRAAKAFAADAADGRADPAALDEAVFSAYLDTAGSPDPDLLIRTSGEMRLSNFLLWQCAYSEIYVTDRLWPDFTIDDMMEAAREFQKRDRRFGSRQRS